MTLPNWTRLPRQAARAAFQRSRRGVTSWARRLKGGVATALRGVDRWLNQSVRGVFGFVESRLGPITVVWIVVVVALSIVFWEWLITGESGSTTIRNLGLVIAAAIALPLAIWRSRVAELQADTAQQNLLNERYQQGAEMLGSEVLSVRLGGIYALRRLAEEHPKQYHVQIMQLFCAFVRNPTEDNGNEGGSDVAGEPPHAARPLREDVQAAMDAIGARRKEYVALEGKARFVLNLHGSDLRGARLTGVNLASATWADWTRVSKAEFLSLGTDTDLSNAKLCSAKLDPADLPEADLSGACLCDAWLTGTDLSGANLSGAKLHKALRWGPILSGAKLSAWGFRPAKGIKQADLDRCQAEPENPPKLDGVLDAETGKPLVWRGKPLDN